jgi:hypothetical protein
MIVAVDRQTDTPKAHLFPGETDAGTTTPFQFFNYIPSFIANMQCIVSLIP